LGSGAVLEPPAVVAGLDDVVHLCGALEMSERRACTLIAADRTMIRYRSRRPPETELRAHAGIALWPTGEQALANCLRLVDMARRFERRACSFRAFVEQIEADAEVAKRARLPSSRKALKAFE
jgi:hypothetical protein